MAKFAKIAFDVKCLGLSASQDAGTLTKGGYPTLKDVRVTFWSQYMVICDLDVNDITTYGNNAFKTGNCLGYLVIAFNDRPEDFFYLAVTSFDEIKTSGRAYYRFLFPARETISQQFIA